MAPALTLDPGEPCPPALEVDKPTPRRRALSSVDNFPPPMEDDDMGLQSAPSLAKDSQEMEQILVDLSTGDLAQTDILQAIKTLESGADNLSTGDADAIFPLSGFDLAEVPDSEGDVVEDKIKQTQIRLERRCAFLLRRLRILQARAIGKRASEEVAQTFEKCIRGARKDGAGRPLGFKALLKKIENTAAVQASSASRSAAGPSYYHAGSSKGDVTKANTIGIQSGTLAGLEDTAGALRSHLEVVKKELDSDATASSSGAESNDEAIPYNNTNQQHMPIEKRAQWSWQRERASISSRWCWLQAQVQELEYKIRQHNDLHKTVRESKGRVEFEGEPSAYQGLLPGQELPDDEPTLETCARVRPLRRETFKKRKLLQMHNLHIATAKAAKSSDIKCSCLHPVESCPVCTGRPEPTQPTTPLCDLPARQRLALADHSYHAVLSDIKDVPASAHTQTLTSCSWFRSRLGKSHRGGHHPTAARHSSHSAHSTISPPKPKPKQREPRVPGVKRGRPPLSRKNFKERERPKAPEKEEETVATPTPVVTQERERTRSRPSTESRTSRQQSFDIDNIVIPQSVAANTRPEILTYKEIITPKWRVLEVAQASVNNGVVIPSHRLSVDVDSDEEDITDAAVLARHTRAEAAERGRYPRTAPRRQDVEVRPPAPPPPPPTDTDGEHEIVRPYSPRRFPLPEHEYMGMLSAMPLGHRRSPSPLPEDDDSRESTMSPISPTIFDGDDPDDTEWNPSVEKNERRKTLGRRRTHHKKAWKS